MKHKSLIFLAFGLIIMAIMLWFIGIDNVLLALKIANPWFILLAILLQCFTYYLYTLRWEIINKIADINLGIKKLLPMVLVSLAVNNITPSGRGGGEPVRAYILSKEANEPFEETFATVIADRALDTFPFIILAVITIIAIIFNFSLSWTIIIALIICVAVICVAVSLLIYMSINEAFGNKVTNWIVKLINRFYKKDPKGLEKKVVQAIAGFQSTMQTMIRDKHILYYALPLSFIIWIAEILRVYLVFLAFGASVSPVIIGEVFIIASLIGMIPLLPGGLGAVDGVMILFYSTAGISASISAAATVIERLISFWMTTLLGFLVLPFYGASVLDKISMTGVNKEETATEFMDELHYMDRTVLLANSSKEISKNLTSSNKKELMLKKKATSLFDKVNKNKFNSDDNKKD